MDSNLPGMGDTDDPVQRPSADDAETPSPESQPESDAMTTQDDQATAHSDANDTVTEGIKDVQAEIAASITEEEVAAVPEPADPVAVSVDESGDVLAAAITPADAAFDASAASGEPDAAADEPAASVEQEAPAEPGAPRLRKGTLVEGTVISTSPTAVMVDVGVAAEGIIPTHELEKLSKSTLDALRVGEKVLVYVVNDHDHNGNVLLSINRAIEEMDWVRAEEHRQSQEVFETKVAGYNKGGLIVRFGRVRGFVPQSQMSADRRRTLSGETPEERWGRMVNESISVKVMEVDRSRNRLILSERTASRESREKRKESLISQLHEGEVRTGRVVSLEDFGAFVDIGGAEGLVHLTELSWKHVTHPREFLQVGQEVRVEVISVNPETKRIGLSMKRQEPDPWDMVAIDYNVGQLVQGLVTKLTKFGAFARLVDVPEIEGLIHISELSDRRVTHPREVVEEGDKLTLRVVKMDIANRRLGLSLKKVNSAEYLDQDWSSFAPSASAEPADSTAQSSAGVETYAEDSGTEDYTPNAADLGTDVYAADADAEATGAEVPATGADSSSDDEERTE